MDVGTIAQLRTLSYDDLLLMIELMPKYKETLTLLLDVFQSEESFIKFLDLFAGREIKLPPRTKLFHTIKNIQVYNYYNSHNNSSYVLNETARQFDITTQYVQTIVDRINNK